MSNASNNNSRASLNNIKGRHPKVLCNIFDEGPFKR